MWYFGSVSEVTEKIINAIRKGWVHEIKEIQKSEKRENIDINYIDDNRDSLFHLAAKNRRFPREGFRQLHIMGCPVNNTNAQGLTPQECAEEEWQRNEITEIINERQRQKLAREKEEQTDFDQKIAIETSDGSRIHPGRYVTPELHLFFGSETKEKVCQIPDTWDELNQEDYQSHLTLHQRLAMIEPFTVGNIRDCNEIKTFQKATASNYQNWLVANIGFVVSDKPHPKSKKQALPVSHKRIFITIPIDDPIYLIYRNENRGLHSERTLYEYLNDVNKIRRIVTLLSEKLKFRFGTYEGHKIYAVVLDMNSSRNMCGDCECDTYNVQINRQNGLLAVLETVLEKEYQFVLPETKSYNDKVLLPKELKLHFVTRVSSYTGGNDSRPIQKLSDTSTFYYEKIVCDEKNTFSPKNSLQRNIKLFKNSVILHTDNESHAKYDFYEKNVFTKLAASGTTFFSVPSQTVFAIKNNDTRTVTRETPKIALK